VAEIVKVGNRRFTIHPVKNGKVRVALVQGMSRGEIYQSTFQEIEPTVENLWDAVGSLLVDDNSTGLLKLAALMRRMAAPEGDSKGE
jgi:hypothetical protein